MGWAVRHQHGCRPRSSSWGRTCDGWPLAGTIVSIAYIAWSVWLIALGVFLIL